MDARSWKKASQSLVGVGLIFAAGAWPEDRREGLEQAQALAGQAAALSLQQEKKQRSLRGRRTQLRQQAVLQAWAARQNGGGAALLSMGGAAERSRADASTSTRQSSVQAWQSTVIKRKPPARAPASVASQLVSEAPEPSPFGLESQPEPLGQRLRKSLDYDESAPGR